MSADTSSVSFINGFLYRLMPGEDDLLLQKANKKIADLKEDPTVF